MAERGPPFLETPCPLRSVTGSEDRFSDAHEIADPQRLAGRGIDAVRLQPDP